MANWLWTRGRTQASGTATMALLADRPTPQAPLVHLLHIMKTGGTSLTRALTAAVESADAGAARSGVFLDDLVRIDAAAWSSMALVAGHLPFETRDLLPADAMTVTVLRDPVERTLSHYAQLTRDPSVAVEHPDFSLDQFLHSPRWRTLVVDYQARQLAHRVGLAEVGRSLDPAERFAALGAPFPSQTALPLQALFDCTPLDPDRHRLLRRALHHLDEIEVVGTVEHLDAVLTATTSRWPGAARQSVGHEQLGENRPTRQDLDRRELRWIDEATELDRALYDEARRRGASLRSIRRAA